MSDAPDGRDHAGAEARGGRPDRDLEGVEERLDRIEEMLGQSRTGGGGIGCLGLILLLYIIKLLVDIRNATGG